MALHLPVHAIFCIQYQCLVYSKKESCISHYEVGSKARKKHLLSRERSFIPPANSQKQWFTAT